MPNKIIVAPFFRAVNRIRDFYIHSQLAIKKENISNAKTPAVPLSANNGRNFQAATGSKRSGKKDSRRYKREDLLKAQFYSYVNPVRIHSADPSAPWYKEYRILESTNRKVIALVGGWKVQFDVQLYEFHKVPDTYHKKQRLINHLKSNPAGIYKGWIHHVNYYGGISKKFKEQQILNFHL